MSCSPWNPVASSCRIIRSGCNCDAGRVVGGDGALECFGELKRAGGSPPAVSTIHQALRRNHLVADQPRRLNALTRFEREVTNHLWQIDATEVRLADLHKARKVTDIAFTMGSPTNRRRPGDGARYCCDGSLAACRASLWSAFDTAVQSLAAAQGPDPARWRGNASRTGFTLGLISDTFPSTNRPTFQQVLQFARR